MKASNLVIAFIGISSLLINVGCSKSEEASSGLDSHSGWYRSKANVQISGMIIWYALDRLHREGVENVQYEYDRANRSELYTLKSRDGFTVTCAKEAALVACSFYDSDSLPAPCTETTCPWVYQGMSYFVHTARVDVGFNKALAKELDIQLEFHEAPEMQQVIDEGGKVSTFFADDNWENAVLCTRNPQTSYRSCAIGKVSKLNDMLERTRLESVIGF